MVSGYCIHVFLARNLSLEGYADFGLAISIVSFLEMIMMQSFPMALRRKVSRNPETLPQSRTSALILTVTGSLVLTALVWVATYLTDTFFNGSYHSGGIVRLASIDLIFFGIFSVFHAELNGRKLFKAQALVTKIYSIARVSCIIAAVIIDPSPQAALIANIVSSVIGMAAGSLMAGWVRPVLSRTQIRKITGFATPSFISAGLQFFMINADFWTLRLVADESASAIYYAASNLARMIWLIRRIIASYFFPYISAAKSRSPELAKASGDAAISIVSIGLLFLAVIASDPGGIMEMMFGQQYRPGANILLILSGALVFQSIYSILSTTLIARSTFTRLLITDTVCMTVLILMLFIMTKYLGAIGAALSLLAVHVLGTVVLWRFISRLTGERLVSIYLLLLSSLSAASAVFIARILPLDGESIINTLIRCSTGGVLCSISMILTGVISIGKLKRLLGLKKVSSS